MGSGIHWGSWSISPAEVGGYTTQEWEICLQGSDFFSFGCVYLEVGLLSCMADIFLIFWGTSSCFPEWPYQFAFLPAVHEGSLVSTSLPTLVVQGTKCWWVLLLWCFQVYFLYVCFISTFSFFVWLRVIFAFFLKMKLVWHIWFICLSVDLLYYNLFYFY